MKSVGAGEATMAENRTPTHRAYAAKREGHHARWLEIGTAIVHADGKGFDVYLDRLPVGGFNGHVVVRANDARLDELVTPSSPSRVD